MGEACGANGIEAAVKCTQIFWGKFEGKKNLKRLYVGYRIILKWKIRA